MSRTETGDENFACQDSDVSQIFKPTFPISERILQNLNVLVEDKINRKTAHFRLKSVAQRLRVPKLPIGWHLNPTMKNTHNQI